MGREHNHDKQHSKSAQHNKNEQQKKLKKLGDAKLDPYEINFLPEYEQGRGSREAFINEYDVIIGDHEYESPNSPLQNWTLDTDPAIMAGDQWVHPYKDIGFHSKENRQLFEEGIEPQGGIFTHPDKDVAYELRLDKQDDAQDDARDDVQDDA